MGHYFLDTQYVQEVVVHFYSKLLHKIGHYFLDTQYVQEVVAHYIY